MDVPTISSCSSPSLSWARAYPVQNSTTHGQFLTACLYPVNRTELTRAKFWPWNTKVKWGWWNGFLQKLLPSILVQRSCKILAKKIWIKIFLRSCMPFPVGHWNRCFWLAVDQSACSRSVFSDFNVPLIVILERWFQNEVESDWYWNGTHTRKVRYSFHSSWSRQWWATARR